MVPVGFPLSDTTNPRSPSFLVPRSSSLVPRPSSPSLVPRPSFLVPRRLPHRVGQAGEIHRGTAVRGRAGSRRSTSGTGGATSRDGKPSSVDVLPPRGLGQRRASPLACLAGAR